jgi:hypothetical protein
MAIRNRATKKVRKKKNKRPIVHPVSAKSARGSGQSRDSRLPNSSPIRAIDRELAVGDNCDALINIKSVVYFKKQRKRRTPNGPAGSWYNGRAVNGEKCGAEAIISFYKGGKRVNRCALHINRGE